MRRRTFLPCAVAAAFAVAFAAPAAFAQAPTPMPGHGDMGHSSGAAASGTAAPTPPSGMTSSQGEMMAAMERMNRAMMAPSAMAGDTDQNLVAMMIPHHQGAIDMARIYLRDGRDPQIRRMAQKIIADQEREIREMRAWQAKHPGPQG